MSRIYLVGAVAAMSVLVLALHVCRADAQTGRGSEQQVRESRLADLEPLIGRVEQAVDRGDVNEARAVVEKIYGVIVKERASTYSPKNLLAVMENRLVEYPRIRPHLIADLAVTAELAGDYAKARSYAREALTFATPGTPFAARNVYYGNHVLGLVSLHDSDVPAAKHYLVASTTTEGWPLLSELGPNVTLAKQLLDRGETESVLEFLERCKKLWLSGVKTIEQWQAIIRQGVTPDFSKNQRLWP